MRCLHCNFDGVPQGADLCPRCKVHLPSLLRDMLPAGTVLHGGKYRIDYPLGRGGFGITYRALHVQLEQAAAVKEFYPQEQAVRDGTTGELSVRHTQRDSYERALKRFVREGRVLARLDHPSVVRVRDLFEERGTAYIVMELVEGKSLREEMDDAPGRRLAPARASEVTAQLVSALEEVHREGVYHLDIKPDNVLLTPRGRAVLIDFGAARQNLPTKTTRAYTPDYAAPEVLAGTEVGPESDVFELGVLLHEMLTGERPPNALSRVMRDDWTPDGLEEPWRTLVVSALRLRREERPASIRYWWETGLAAGRQTPHTPPPLGTTPLHKETPHKQTPHKEPPPSRPASPTPTPSRPASPTPPSLAETVKLDPPRPAPGASPTPDRPPSRTPSSTPPPPVDPRHARHYTPPASTPTPPAYGASAPPRGVSPTPHGVVSRPVITPPSGGGGSKILWVVIGAVVLLLCGIGVVGLIAAIDVMNKGKRVNRNAGSNIALNNNRAANLSANANVNANSRVTPPLSAGTVYASDNFPAAPLAKIREVVADGETLRSVTFGAGKSWCISAGDDLWYEDIPTSFINKKPSDATNLRVTANARGDWYGLYGGNGWWGYGSASPADAKLTEFNSAHETVNFIAFGETTSWIIVKNGDEWYQHGLDGGLVDALEEATGDIRVVALKRDNGWVLVTGRNTWSSSLTIPSECDDRMRQLAAAGRTISLVAFAPNGGWVVVSQE